MSPVRYVVLFLCLVLLLIGISFLYGAPSSVSAQGSKPTATLVNQSQAHRPVNGSWLMYLPLVTKNSIAQYSEMVYIPAGEFEMGCDPGADNCGGTYYNGYLMETPLHRVFLDAYWIDRYVVTNKRYAACVSAGVCYAPAFDYSATHYPYYYSDPTYANYPVLWVNAYMAGTFCNWEGKRLPTEAEWEKAARGSTDTRRYPWGNPEPVCSQANFRDYGGLCVGDVMPVDSYPMDVSPYNISNMMGNVWNWVSDWYQQDYYNFSPYANPKGPGAPVTSDSCNYCRVVRGGSWYSTMRYGRDTYRGRVDPFTLADSLGIRCAR